jgi:ribosome maturation protein SDO1
LDKGELQIGEKERDEQLLSMFKDIANILVEKCVHPVTKRPISIEAIKKAMKDTHFPIRLDQPPKRQALECFKLLQRKYMITRAEMKIHITLPATLEEK